MKNETTDNYKDKSLNQLLNEWQEGKLNDEQKDYVVSKIPIMAYIDRNKDYSKVAEPQKH